MATYRSISRLEHDGTSSDNREHIKLGCLQRIADATELMAQRYQELLTENERLKEDRNRLKWYLTENTK